MTQCIQPTVVRPDTVRRPDMLVWILSLILITMAGAVAKDCQIGLGNDYTGTIQVTEYGNKCQRWDSNSPHAHNMKSNSMFPDGSVSAAANYCRNPNNRQRGVWCYTTDSNNEWEYCDVPFCKTISFKRVNQFEFIYNDRNTGSHQDFSVWRPTTPESGYYALGDAARASHGRPIHDAIMVKEMESGALAEPYYATEIWNDRGSGGTYDVRIMRLHARSGYHCLGNVAVIGYNNFPDYRKYRCVKSTYLTNGLYGFIWKDRGSGASMDFSAYEAEKLPSSTVGLNANIFRSHASHSWLYGNSKVPDGRYFVSHLLINQDKGKKPILLMEVSSDQTTEIWRDRGSGAHRDFSIHRTEITGEYCPLGDIGVNAHRKPSAGFIAKAIKEDEIVFKRPVGFRQIWNDRGSGANDDVAFYRPDCPTSYRALGYVSVKSHYTQPSSDSMCCVRDKYTIQGRWEKVWDDSGSGANDDVAVWKAMPVYGTRGQGVLASSMVKSHGNMPHNAYVLNADYVYYMTGKPAKKYILTNVDYQLDDRHLVGSSIATLSRTFVTNRGDTTSDPTVRTHEISYEETYSWSIGFGLEIGVETTVKAGIPLIGSSETTISMTTSFSSEWGSEITESKTDSIATSVSVAPRSRKEVFIVGHIYKADIPYTATLEIEYEDGSRITQWNYNGIYHGVTVTEFRVTYGKDIPL